MESFIKSSVKTIMLGFNNTIIEQIAVAINGAQFSGFNPALFLYNVEMNCKITFMLIIDLIKNRASSNFT